jgi:mRNA interferase RelE/StbE
VAYEILFEEGAAEALAKLDGAVRTRVAKVIDRLAENPRPGQATQLVTDAGTWRIRTGDWRILYEIHDDRLVVLVLDVQHRSRAY